MDSVLKQTELETLFQERHFQKVILVAPGPTISSMPELTSYDLAIFMGDSFLRTAKRSIRNIYVRANTEFPRLDNPAHVARLMEFEGEILLASSVMESDAPVLELARQALPGKNVYVFDQRHFSQQNCAPLSTCCEGKMPVTLQELLARKANFKHHYSQGATVLLHALAIGLLFGAKEIEVFGADLPLRRSQYVYGGTTAHPQPRGLKNSLLVLKRKFKTLRSVSLGFTFQYLRKLAALRLLGDNSPSVFADDAFSLASDFQYLSDCAAILGARISVFGPNSNLLKIAGFRQILK